MQTYKNGLVIQDNTFGTAYAQTIIVPAGETDYIVPAVPEGFGKIKIPNNIKVEVTDSTLELD